MSAPVVRPTAQTVRPQPIPEQTAKPVAPIASRNRRSMLSSGLLGLTGFGGQRAASAEDKASYRQSNTEDARHAPSMEHLQANQIGMRALKDSELAVSVYPTFTYDASGGGGIADAHDLGDGRLHVKFDADTLYIPDVYYKTAKFLGAPMAPPFRIKIKPVKLEGEINRTTGEAALEFIANFMFTAGPLYKAPPLYVVTKLTTEEVQGTRRHGKGTRLDADGFSRLVGCATVPKTDSWPIDKFLMLPDETFAVMAAQFVFPSA